MHKLTEYVELAATEFLQETGKHELDSVWLAEFFQDGGVLDEYPNQSLVEFYTLVSKAMRIKIEKAEKLSRIQQEKTNRSINN